MNYGINSKTIQIQTLPSDNPSVSPLIEGNIRKQNEKIAEFANKHRLPHQCAVGDKVCLSTKHISLEDNSGSRKLHPKVCSPFVVKKKINDVNFQLELSEPMKLREIHDTFHVSHLKPYTEDLSCREPQPEPAVLFDDGYAEFTVEKILSNRQKTLV